MPVTLLDTSTLAPQEREVATREFVETIAELDAVGHACPPESIRTRVRAWDLRKFQLGVTDGAWLRLGLSRPATTETVCISAQVGGQAAKSRGEQRQTFAPGQVDRRLLKPVPVVGR